ncbi:MAG: asparagine synthase (glutamine-hydrolyzing) [Planctomycetes bacterium]|nr:asparagine synthase (glutamine-hydrolyzing) [Planctomycetota bacterium]
MCGIAGAVGAIDAEVRAALARAHAAQAHRGPDAEGLWPDSGASERVLFAHRRLAILDLSPEANQPMRDDASGCVLVFNGEIYNFAALRDELRAAGRSFRTRSDTEVLLAAYAQWGDECVRKLRGMYAFALFDPRRRTVLLARDPLGEKPLYWTLVRRNGAAVLLFASELRSLLATGLVERKLEKRALASYLWHGFVCSDRSLVRGVELLPAGSRASISIDAPQCKPERWWHLPEPEAPRSSMASLRASLEQAVREQLVSDVPLGVFLSGGIDSSAVASLAARAGAGAVHTFTIGFDETAYDESKIARAVADSLGTTHREIRLTEQNFTSGLDGALRSLDQPSFDALNTYFVSRAVREAGITVALAGTGGDELFGGYRSFAELPKARKWARRLRPVPASLLRAAAGLAARMKTGPAGEVPPQTRWGKLGDLLATRGSLVALYQVAYGLYTQRFLAELAPAPLFEGTAYGLELERLDRLERDVQGHDARAAIARLELESFIGQRLLRDGDTASMAVSLEVRVPLLDSRIVETASALPPTQRFEPLGRKQVLRDLALDNLEKALFEREKSGFVLPIERWCRASLAGEVGALLTDAAACEAVGLDPRAIARLWRAFSAGAPGLYWSRIWSLYVLLWWCRAQKVEIGGAA